MNIKVMNYNNQKMAAVHDSRVMRADVIAILVRRATARQDLSVTTVDCVNVLIDRERDCLTGSVDLSMRACAMAHAHLVTA